MSGFGVDRGSGASSGNPDSPIGQAVVDAKGDLIAGTADNSVARLAVGTDNQRLVADASQTTGLKYVSDTQNTVIDAKGDLLVGTADNTAARLAVGTDGQALVADSTQSAGVKWSGITSPGLNSLVDYLHIDTDTGHRDIIRGGWYPAFFNQQWGGAPHYFELVDTATGVPRRFEAATGNIDDESSSAVGGVAGNTWAGQGFKVSKSTTLAAMWVKVYKIGNPTNNLECRILPDDGTGKPSGSTAITNGTATAQSGKLHSSDTNGQWVRFVFPTPPSLTAGTQYHVTLKSSGAVDASNNWNWRRKGSAGAIVGAYPHGQFTEGDGTPTWTAFSTIDRCFLAEIAASDESLVSGGIFNDGKLTFFEGASGVLNQSNGRVKDLRDFTGLDLTDFTLALYGTAWTKDKTIIDITYGLDHDRIVLRCNVTTGFAQLDLYDSSGNKKTVTGTTDVSGGDSLLGIRVRAKGDGADKVELWENGVKNAASLSAQTISFDKLFGLAKLGTFWLGGGWQVTPAWTKDTAMGSLPSADGWTWTGVATEANAMSVSGGKLYQNKNGYTALQDGYYLKNTLALSNANGWGVTGKVRVSSDTNTKDQPNVAFNIEDGTKAVAHRMHEYFMEAGSTTNYGYPQLDAKSAESVVAIVGKGTDVLHFVNGRLVIDGTGQLTSASANNQIKFGDTNTTSGENADAVWDYVKYYNTAWLPPQFTAGSLSELAIWNGDRTALLATLWNAASPLSVKVTCGMTRNTLHDDVVQRRRQFGITSAPTSTSSVMALAPEMECFVIGGMLFPSHQTRGAQSNAGQYTGIEEFIDGARANSNADTASSRCSVAYSSLANNEVNHALPAVAMPVSFGLHKVEMRWATGAATGTLTAKSRELGVEARA